MCGWCRNASEEWAWSRTHGLTDSARARGGRVAREAILTSTGAGMLRILNIEY